MNTNNVLQMKFPFLISNADFHNIMNTNNVTQSENAFRIRTVNSSANRRQFFYVK